MLGRVKSFFAFLVSHWIMTLVFLLGVVAFAAGPLANVYDAIRARVPFLPARRGT
jgi:hypothetical protein